MVPIATNRDKVLVRCDDVTHVEWELWSGGCALFGVGVADDPGSI
jgi:hypothetical protein